jgi:hypothetical protein
MNVDTIKNSLTQKFGRTGLVLQKHSPEILLGAGLIGMAVTVVLASKATLKVDEIVQEHNSTMERIDEAIKDEGKPEYTPEVGVEDKGKLMVQTGLKLTKLYGPAIGVGVLSISAILASHGVMAQRQVALVAAYNLLGEAYKNYRGRVVEELGEEKDLQFHLGLRESERTVSEENEDGKKVKVKRTVLVAKGPMPSIYARCFDSSNPMFRSDRLLNRAFLTAQQNYVNDVLILRGHVFLNEVYERLGFPHTSEGALVGWVLRDPDQMKEEKRDGYISFGIDDPRSEADREFMRGENDAIWLDFNVDGIVYNLI